MIPMLPEDKANHLFYGALIQCVLSFIGGPKVALFAVFVVALAKEGYDYVANGRKMTGIHEVSVNDFIATLCGSLLVFLPTAFS